MQSLARPRRSSGFLSLWVNRGVPDSVRLQATSLHHDVQAFILRATHEGVLGPGDRLSESAVGARLGVSRTPVREALTYLEGSGLVVRRPRRGFFLAALDATAADHYYAMREVLEAFAARQVADRLTPAQIAELRDIIATMGRAAGAGDWPQAAMHNIAFHEAVVSMAANPVLLRMWTSVGPVLWYFDSLTSKLARRPDRGAFVQRHLVLLQGLCAGDPEAAAAAFIEHIRNVKASVINRLNTRGRSRRGSSDEWKDSTRSGVLAGRARGNSAGVGESAPRTATAGSPGTRRGPGG